MPTPRWRRRADLITAVALLLAAGLCTFSAGLILESRKTAWARAQETAENVGRAVRGEIARTIGLLDLSLHGVIDRLRAPGMAGLDPALRNLALFDRAATARHVVAILVLDRDGRVALDSRLAAPTDESFAHREYFQAHLRNPAAGLHVSAPFQGRAREGWFFAISRRIVDEDGGFAGVAAGILDLGHLRDLFERLTLGPDASLTLFREDGTVLLRMPSGADAIGANIGSSRTFREARDAEGRPFTGTAALDGVERLYAPGRVEGTPLILNIGLGVADIEARWQPRGLKIGAVTLLLAGGLAVTTMLFRRELIRRHRLEAQARASAAAALENESRFRLLAENSCDMVTRVTNEGVRTYVSPASRRLVGRAPESMLGTRPEEDIHPDDRQAVAAAAGSMRAGAIRDATLTYRLRHANGGWVWVEATVRVVRDPDTGEPDGVVAVARDVTKRKRLETELTRLASQDGLTGLANRRVFDEALSRFWGRALREEMPLSVLLLDVDHFKAFNDRHGHQGGDECLRMIAAAIAASVRRPQDLVARWGGEEFAVLLPDTDETGAVAAAERLRAEIEALALPHGGRGAEGAPVTLSLGVATFHPLAAGAPSDPRALLAAADAALYDAKRRGQNRVALAVQGEAQAGAAFLPAAPTG